MSGRIFVDETRAHGYVLAATYILPRDVKPTRKALARLRMPGQRRIHFNHEGDSRRRAVVSAICQMNCQTTIYDASLVRNMTNERQARLACLEALVPDAVERHVTVLALERGDAHEAEDKRNLFELAHKAGCLDTLSYKHWSPYQESLLWIPDALAWCWARGGHWRQRARPAIAGVRVLRP